MERKQARAQREADLPRDVNVTCHIPRSHAGQALDLLWISFYIILYKKALFGLCPWRLPYGPWARHASPASPSESYVEQHGAGVPVDVFVVNIHLIIRLKIGCVIPTPHYSFPVNTVRVSLYAWHSMFELSYHAWALLIF